MKILISILFALLIGLSLNAQVDVVSKNTEHLDKIRNVVTIDNPSKKITQANAPVYTLSSVEPIEIHRADIKLKPVIIPVKNKGVPYYRKILTGTDLNLRINYSSSVRVTVR